PNDRSPDRRLKIGYVSPDFREHVVGHNVLPIIRDHDRSQFEIFCYSNVRAPDEMTDRFKELADQWRPIYRIPDEEVAKKIREDQIDILVDLALHMSYGRLLVFARMPAPVQATFAGYPGGTGLDAIGYRLSDPYLDPPEMTQTYQVERCVRLPDTFWCYDPEGMETHKAPPIAPLPAEKNGFITFGCFNNFCKINDGVLDLWGRVLAAVPKSRLTILCQRGPQRQWVLDRLAGQKVAADRVEFVERTNRVRYLTFYSRIDIGLDTFPYNGHTTSLDSLWMGVPVVTLVGQTPVARAGFSQLCNLDLRQLAASNQQEFVSIAAALAADLPRLAELRRNLRPRMLQSPLCDAVKFTRNIEAAYRRMWQEWVSR
ncbi:MAG TPA: hypothetical protein VMD30_08935, partial [Tepidisphaeraceae bacterium]|nr:hypothetical protein [Tepidisphaeraceae bacterium]